MNTLLHLEILFHLPRGFPYHCFVLFFRAISIFKFAQFLQLTLTTFPVTSAFILLEILQFSFPPISLFCNVSFNRNRLRWPGKVRWTLLWRKNNFLPALRKLFNTANPWELSEWMLAGNKDGTQGGWKLLVDLCHWHAVFIHQIF